MRIRNRVVAGVAVVVAALVVTGCGSGDGDSDGGGSGGGEGKASASATPGGEASSGSDGSGSAGSGSAGSAKDTEGIWSATTSGQAVVLVVGGDQASLSTGDGHLCTGTVTGSGKPALDLKCADGNTDRTAGAIESNDGTTMKVSWGAGTADTFTKSADGKLPSGLPTGLPSGLPTN
ncbi:hypothetical protein OKJ48_22730 [Streptomyces kunmingensis]|uniref:Serine/threonine protein kinase n=1 Tax=Streptomyces kunmingensis TaxID=68225 RepID=A0ABU6CEB0_9ACTN|nr:hypothetical protein [Streptomyces kunmingensis]MEB3963041.1 hypothetical protein [Streptomyces kunmingensis]